MPSSASRFCRRIRSPPEGSGASQYASTCELRLRLICLVKPHGYWVAKHSDKSNYFSPGKQSQGKVQNGLSIRACLQIAASTGRLQACCLGAPCSFTCRRAALVDSAMVDHNFKAPLSPTQFCKSKWLAIVLRHVSSDPKVKPMPNVQQSTCNAVVTHCCFAIRWFTPRLALRHDDLSA